MFLYFNFFYYQFEIVFEVVMLIIKEDISFLVQRNWVEYFFYPSWFSILFFCGFLDYSIAVGEWLHSILTMNCLYYYSLSKYQIVSIIAVAKVFSYASDWFLLLVRLIKYLFLISRNNLIFYSTLFIIAKYFSLL